MGGSTYVVQVLVRDVRPGRARAVVRQVAREFIDRNWDQLNDQGFILQGVSVAEVIES